jgi:hypothetical protein
MLTLLVVIFSALVIMAIVAAVNRRRESLVNGARTSGTSHPLPASEPAQSEPLPSPLITGIQLDAASSVVAAEVASKIGTNVNPIPLKGVPCRNDRQLYSSS